MAFEVKEITVQTSEGLRTWPVVPPVYFDFEQDVLRFSRHCLNLYGPSLYLKRVIKDDLVAGFADVQNVMLWFCRMRCFFSPFIFHPLSSKQRQTHGHLHESLPRLQRLYVWLNHYQKTRDDFRYGPLTSLAYSLPNYRLLHGPLEERTTRWCNIVRGDEGGTIFVVLGDGAFYSPSEAVCDGFDHWF